MPQARPDTTQKSLSLNPKLKKQAEDDGDLKSLRENPEFEELIKVQK